MPDGCSRAAVRWRGTGGGGGTRAAACSGHAALLTALAVILAGAAAAASSQYDDSGCLDLQVVIDGALGQLEATAAIRQRPDGSGPTPAGPDAIPADMFLNGTNPASGLWEFTNASKWTAGYLSGCYWRAYALSGDSVWAELGTAELPGLTVVASETDNHKVSHIFDSSYGEALAAGVPGTPVAKYQRVIQTAAKSLAARFNSKVGAIQSWKPIGDKNYSVIIDSMASLKIMWEAARMPGGDPAWADIAMTHARKVMMDNFRPDGSTYHVVRYNPKTGRMEWRGQGQGYRDDSTWSRGQAWAVVGFTHVYNATRDPAMLATAQRAANYFLLRLAESDDGVPPWDFDVPPSARMPYKDSSAGAIAASGLLRLGALTGNATYTRAGINLVASLSDAYLGWTEGGQKVAAILRNGTGNAPKGVYGTGLSWGDWYFLDALSSLATRLNVTCTYA